MRYADHDPFISPQSDVDKLDREIEALCFVRESLLKNTSDLILRLKERRNSQIPWAKLPVELQSQVCIEDARSLTGRERMERALELGQVSTSWRNVVINTPRLWTAIDTDSLDLANLILTRSKNVPLDVEISPTSSQVALVAIGVHIHRWRSLDAEASDVRRLLSYLREPLPVMERLYIDYESEMGLPFTFHFGGGARLVDLDLATVYPTNPESIILSGLTRLALLTMPIPDNILIGILQACPSVEDLLFDGLEYLDTGAPLSDSPRLIRPSLKTLEIDELEEDMAVRLLTIIDAENIQFLSISGSGNPFDIDVETLSLSHKIIHNTAPDRVEISLEELSGALVVYKGVEHVLRIHFNRQIPLEQILQHFPTERIDLPTELHIGGIIRRSLLIEAPRLSGLRKITVKDTHRYTSEATINFLRWLTKPQGIDGTLQWPAPFLNEIRIASSPEGDELRRVLSQLLGWRGVGGGLDATLLEEYRNMGRQRGWKIEELTNHPCISLEIVNADGTQWISDLLPNPRGHPDASEQ